MLTEAELRRVTGQALAASLADQTEVLVFDSDSALTRFANNEIHQNVAERDIQVLVRTVFGKKIGVASVNRADEQGVRQAVERATALSRFQVDNPDFRSLPEPRAVPTATAVAYSHRTAEFTPAERARAVDVVVRRAMDAGLVAAGAFSTSVSQVAVASSLGAFCTHASTEANFSTVVMSGSSSGYADRLSMDAGEIDPEAIAREAVDKAQRGQDPRPLDPGEYEVVLDEYAVSDLVDFLADLGFGALAVQEERSFMAGRFGQQILGQNVSIWDDALSPETIPMPFDFEGVPRQRVDLIEHGIARAVVYDSLTAGRENKESTGHALPAGSTYGPFPMHLHMAPGTASKEELISSVRRGLWVTRFWYTRTVHPLTATITGMTRDGTFLIENGEIVAPVRNLRFTQSYLEALSNVDLMTRETWLKQTMFPYNRIPALKIARWNFTGATEY